MFFQRLYNDGLAQASYLIGCEGTGEAVVIDANRDIHAYLAVAKAAKLRITAVVETHIHADFLSGTRELAKRTGAALLLSGEGGPDWQYGFAASDDATLLHNGDSFSVGHVRFNVLHTPGHTPEHLAFLVTDLATSDLPLGLLSGDFVFVGDVGRPDLLERAAHVSRTMETAARALFHSLRRFRWIPDFVQLWPGHGAGSACGKALGSMPQSTVGYEKLTNWGVAALDEASFVAEVLAGQPEPPTYFAEMKRLNRDGPPMLGAARASSRLKANTLAATLRDGAIVVDVRSADAFATAHILGTLNIPLGKAFSTWAGWLLPYDHDLWLIVDRDTDAKRALHELAMIGLDRVVGWFGNDALTTWTADGGTLERVPQTTVGEISPLVGSGAITVLDVRNQSEWDHGHLIGALHIPVGQVAARIGEIPRHRPVVVHCGGGARSAIAASVLLMYGLHDVSNLRGGYSEWVATGNPVTRSTAPSS